MDRLSRTIQSLPDIPDGFFLNPQSGYFSVVCPEETINLVEDPDLSSVANFINTATSIISHPNFISGTRAFSVTTNGVATQGVGYAVPTAVNGGKYTFSMWAKSSTDLTIRMFISDFPITTALSGVKTITLNEHWQQISLTVNFSGFVGQVALRVDSVNEGNFITDAWQFEEKPYATSFVSGSLPEGEWIGVENSSVSRRAPDDYRGGRVTNFNDLGFILTEIEGIGLPEQDILSNPYALQNGSKFRCTRIEERDLTLSGRVYGCLFKDLLCRKGSIATKFKGLTRFYFQPKECDENTGNCVFFDAIYEDGLHGDYTSTVGEEVSIDLKMLDVFFYSCCQKSEQLTLQTTEQFEGGFIGEDFDGGVVGFNPNAPFPINSTITASCIGFDDNLYYAQTILTAEVICFDGTVNTTIGSSSTVPVHVNVINDIICCGKYLYVTGDFNPILNPTVTGTNIGRYNIVTGLWDNIGSLTGGAGIGRTLAKDKDGRIYVGGDFTSAGGGGAVNTIASANVAIYDPSINSWIAPVGGHGLGTGSAIFSPALIPVPGDASGSVTKIVVNDITGMVYIGGDFVNGANTATTDFPNGLVRYDPIADTFTQLDYGYNGGLTMWDLEDMIFYNNHLIVGGRFDDVAYTLAGPPPTPAGTDFGNIAWLDEPSPDPFSVIDAALLPFNASTYIDATRTGVFTNNGFAFSPVTSFYIDDGELYISGNLQEYDLLNTFPRKPTCGYVKFVQTGTTPANGYYVEPSINLRSFVTPSGIYPSCYITGIIGGSRKIGYDRIYVTPDSGNVANTDVFPFNTFDACTDMDEAKPEFVISGETRIKQIVDSQGNAVNLDYFIDVDDVVTISFSNNTFSIVSRLNGDVTAQSLQTGSRPLSFNIYPGQNKIRLVLEDFVAGATGVARWRPRFLSAETAACSECC